MLARYCFVFLHEFIAIAACWRNRLNRDPCARGVARAAPPVLDRLRRDWSTYEPVRHYLAAKRREADADRTADLDGTFMLWRSIGELSVTALVDDAIQVFELLAETAPSLSPIDDARVAPCGVSAALRSLVVPGSDRYREASMTTYAPARSGTMPLIAGGELSRRIRQVNDVIDHSRPCAPSRP
ncbi:MAG TPA: hypothetical protein VGO80_18675 [Solirubrobacteraceae bacterium]|nr:hypothetical protein [Solirubrobacteraceae bacterium]